ncbi:hypothetical protein MTAT_16890 [Moorella thermoacetica]|uniref:Bacterial Ig-like domain (Group 1) n=1 Tax=Neomoorella thermoacetica TaxID=1525 RepID=A0AAC9MU09_NEOTH|nr:invasin domain 3-containing protein [Moorella thermoacetica]AOQ23159.1 Bacterial Ig-like domain (group 1) [Moorella thermoacetica]TYL12866.1 hypothetical protein MTAT_16890 [Moorella thermoacetica]
MTKVKATKSIVGVLLIVVLLLFSGTAFAEAGNSKGSLSDTVTSLQVDSATTEVVQPDQSEQQVPDVGQPQQDQAIDQEEAVVPEPKKLPIAKVEPENGATLVRPDAPIRIVFDTNSPFFTHVDKQLKKGHFFVTVNGEKVAAEYDGKGVVTANPGLLKRYTKYDVKFLLHPQDNGQHNGFGNGNGQPWENKSYEFSFETGSDLNEPRHVKLEALSSAPKVTDNGGVMELSFTDDYGQPGYGAKGIVRLTEYGAWKPNSAKADPAEFTVQQGSDGKQVVRITDTEAEKVSVEAAISGPYAEDAATVTAEFTFRPGPAAKISLSPDKEKVVVGQSLNVSGTAVDMYDNPVEDGTAVSVTASAGEAANTSTKDGAFSFAYTAPTKKQPVNLTVKVDQCEAKLDIPVVADAPAKITVTPEKQKAIAGSPVKVSVLVEDQYGNPVEDGTKVMLVASGGTVSPSEAVTKDGVVEVQAISRQTGEVAVKASTENGVSGSVAISFVSVVPAGSRVKLDALPGNIPGEYTVKGQVTKDGTPVPSVAVPLIVKNGELSDPMPVTNQQGEFSVTLKKGDSSGCVTVAVDGSQAPGVTSGTVGIDPLVYGNQTWTDTGIDVGAGLLIRVNATGTWASELYAKVGDSGTPVKVGTNGGFVTGATGRLYLGPNTAGYADDVDAIIYVDDPAAVGILPTISLTANPTQIPADGKSTSALDGKVMYGQYPGVGVAVNLSATLGTVSPASPITGADGSYQATFTAGTQGGTATVTATYGKLSQNVNITLAYSQTVLPPNYVKTFKSRDAYGREIAGVMYTRDGVHWGMVILGRTVGGLVWDSVLQKYFVVCNKEISGNLGVYLVGVVYSSADGITWNECFRTTYNLYTIATNGNGTIVVGGGWDGPYGINSAVYTTINGTNWSQTLTGYKSKLNGLYVTGTYIGIVQKITWLDNHFIAEGISGFTWYSATSHDGFNWFK